MDCWVSTCCQKKTHLEGKNLPETLNLSVKDKKRVSWLSTETANKKTGTPILSHWQERKFELYGVAISIGYKQLKWVKVAQSCPTLCDPTDCIVHGVLEARIPEWVAVSFSRGSSQPRDWAQVSHIEGGFFASWATGESKNSQTLASPCSSNRQHAATWILNFLSPLCSHL